MGRAIIHDNARKYVKQLLWSYTTSERSQWVVKPNMNSADSPDIENCGNLNKSQYVDPLVEYLTTNHHFKYNLYNKLSALLFFFLA